jgi:hypothetical protein
MNDASTSFKECPKCGTANLPIAKFCNHCGVSFEVEAAPSPHQPPRPSPQPYPNTAVTSENSVSLAMDAATAFAHATSVIQAAGGELNSISPPKKAKFRLNKSFGFMSGKGEYLGVVSISPGGINNSVCKVDLKYSFSSRVGWNITGSVFILFMSIAAMAVHPTGSLLLLLIPLMWVGDFWQGSTEYRKKYKKEILEDIVASSAQVYSGKVSSIQQPAQFSPNPDFVDTNKAEIHEVTPPDIAERIKSLDSLLKEKLITQEEYDAKKAELLNKL